MSSAAQQILNFDVDKYVNPFVPPNPLKHLPKPISHWLGYRSEKQQDPPVIVSVLFAFLGAFVGLIVAGAIFVHAPGIHQYHPPALIASFGATAVLEYSAIYTPLSQPRNALLGQTLSAIIGVAICQGCQHWANFNGLEWVAGALACATAIVVMNLTNTIHPPGGATAVIACTEPAVIAMGWFLVPVVMVGILAMLGVALINNNITRQFPLYWWTSAEVGSKLRRQKQSDIEGGENDETRKNSEETRDDEDSKSDTTLRPRISNMSFDSEVDSIHIIRHHLTVPANLQLSEAEMEVLRNLQHRLQEAKG